MEKPKTLEQLRAEKKRAETRLAQEQHKLHRLENRKRFLWNRASERNALTAFAIWAAQIPKENWKESFERLEIKVIPVEEVQEILEHVFLPESLAEGMELLQEKGIS